MENPHQVFLGIAACSVLLTATVLFVENRESIGSMLAVFLPVILVLSVVVMTAKFRARAHLRSE